MRYTERKAGDSSGFLRALPANDLEAMNDYMNDISCELSSSFNTGGGSSEKVQPERFYHGFVLGMMVELRDRYLVTSNRESGYGRYDIMLEPKERDRDAHAQFVNHFMASGYSYSYYLS